MNSSYQEASELNEVSEDIRASYIWVVFLLGFPTNIFSIVTVLTMRTLTPATFYVAALALCDGLALLGKLVGHQMASHGAYFGPAGCKAAFLPAYVSAVASWLLVFICAERCVSVCLPLKKHIIVTRWRAYASTIGAGLLLLIVYASVFGTMRDSTPDGLLCGTLDGYVRFWVTAWYWINVCLHLLLPLPIIVLLTALIICAIHRSRHDRRAILQNGTGRRDGNSRLLKETERLERTITVMLVLAATIFAVLSLPACVFVLAYRPSPDPLVQARWRLFDQIQFLCMDSSHAVNFFLYFLSSKKFRDQFIFLVTCHRRPTHLRKSTSSHTTSSFSTKYTAARSDDVSHM